MTNDKKNLAYKILSLPVVSKYKTLTANLYDNCLIIPLASESRKNFFNKTIEQINKYKLVKFAMYEKAQDATVSDVLAIYFNE